VQELLDKAEDYLEDAITALAETVQFFFNPGTYCKEEV
jgi:hypothetical protein